MKFDLADFWELDTKALMAINGGGTCGGGSCSSGGSSYRGGGSCSSSSSYGGSCGSGSYGGSCGGGNLSNKNNELKYQIPYDANDYHCDIKAYNEAIDHGATNPGNWNGNLNSVDEIYNENYEGMGTNSPQANTSGYVFYDFNNDGKFGHMEYFEAGSGSSYTVFQNDGISDSTEVIYNSNVDCNGSAGSGNAIFVQIS